MPELVKHHMRAGTFRDTYHSSERRTQRGITLPEMRYVLCRGFHEKRKDAFDETHWDWTYAMRGKTVDGRELRICVVLQHYMLIITAIDLDAS